MNIFKKGCLSDTEIFQWLTTLRKNAHIPESAFAVSAVFHARNDNADDYYFSGVNVENADHRLSTHAEEGAIAAMVAGLGRDAGIVEGWVMGAPRDMQSNDKNGVFASCCGKCRQQIAGFARESVKIHSVSLGGDLSSTTVGAFLPDPFTFRQYLPNPPPFQEKNNTGATTKEAIAARLIRKSPVPEAELSNWLRTLESVDDASGLSHSVVLKLDNGFCVAGTKIEEAAFNSISAAQSAVAIAVTAFGECRIQEIWSYTKTRKDGKPVTKTARNLTFSALQVLSCFAGHGPIPICYLSDDGITRTTLP